MFSLSTYSIFYILFSFFFFFLLVFSMFFFFFFFFFSFFFFLFFFFFFQAEDGIRDLTVTGVQTCALPISRFASALASLPSILSNSDCSLSVFSAKTEKKPQTSTSTSRTRSASTS